MFALQFERCLAPSGPKLPILLNTAVYGHKPAKQINAWIVTVGTDWNRSPRNLLFLNPGSKCRRHPQIEGPHRGINSRFTPCCYLWMNKWLATSMLIRWTYMARLKNIRMLTRVFLCCSADQLAFQSDSNTSLQEASGGRPPTETQPEEHSSTFAQEVSPFPSFFLSS